MTAGIPVLVFLVQAALAWALRSGWTTFDGWAFLDRAASAPWGDPFHPLVAPTLAASRVLLAPLGVDAADAATLISCVASGLTAAFTWMWFTASGIRRGTAVAPALAVVWSGVAAWASTSIEAYAPACAAVAGAFALAARVAHRPTDARVVGLGAVSLLAAGFHVATVATWPGLAWIALHEAPPRARRVGTVVAAVASALLAALLAIPTREFVPLGSDAIATTPFGWILATISAPSAATVREPWVRSGLPYAFLLLTVPAVSGAYGLLRRDTRALVLVGVLPAWFLWVITGKSWIALAVPLSPLLLLPLARRLDALRHPITVGTLITVAGFGLAAEYGPNGPGFRERHFTPDPLRVLADTVHALAPKDAVVIAGNAAAPLKIRRGDGVRAIAEWAVRGRAAGQNALDSLRFGVTSLQAEGRDVWMTKDAVDFLVTAGHAERDVLDLVDPTTLLRAGPDDARVARLKKNIPAPPR